MKANHENGKLLTPDGWEALEADTVIQANDMYSIHGASRWYITDAAGDTVPEFQAPDDLIYIRRKFAPESTFIHPEKGS